MKTFNPSLCHLHENKGHWSYKEPIKELIMIKNLIIYFSCGYSNVYLSLSRRRVRANYNTSYNIIL